MIPQHLNSCTLERENGKWMLYIDSTDKDGVRSVKKSFVHYLVLSGTVIDDKGVQILRNTVFDNDD